MKKKNMLNIYDIAEKAGVSIATVSRVISNSSRVRPETKKRVMEVIKSTGYVPNAFARGLGLGSMKMAGILCTDISDMYYANLVSALEKLLREKNLDTLLYCTGNEISYKKKYLRHLVNKRADAVILAGSTFSEHNDNSHIEEAAAKMPVIIINGYVDCPGVYCILCEEKKAMRENVHRLYKAGCRNILYIYDADTYSGLQKLEGYKQGLRECLLDPLIIHCKKDLNEISALSEQAMLTQNADGILTSEDIIGIGALKALKKLKLSMPVIGFNNSILAECSTPTLSSVDNMAETLCTTAIGVLSSVLNKTDVVPSKIVIDAKLIERETYNNTSYALT